MHQRFHRAHAPIQIFYTKYLYYRAPRKFIQKICIVHKNFQGTFEQCTDTVILPVARTLRAIFFT